MNILGKVWKSVKDWDKNLGKGQREKLIQEEEKLRNDAVELLRRLSLDPEYNSESDIRFANAKEMVEIWKHSGAKGIREFATVFKGNSFETLSIDLLTSLYHQNWVLIRQNELLIKQVKDLTQVLKKDSGEK